MLAPRAKLHTQWNATERMGHHGRLATVCSHFQLLPTADGASQVTCTGAGSTVYDFPDWNSASTPVVAMTEEQKFFFDLKGWILLPGVLSPSECDELKAEVVQGGVRNCYSGRLQTLIDHPAVVGILTEILSEPPFGPNSEKEDTYLPFRLENSNIQYRPTEADGPAPPGARSDQNKGTRLAHVVRPPQQANAMRYQVSGGRIYSGLTRVVWELEEVHAGMGGTTFLSGSRAVSLPVQPANTFLALAPCRAIFSAPI